MWRDLLKGNEVYHRSILYRNHLFNPFVYKKIIKSDYTLLILILVLILTVLQPNYFWLSTYFILIFIKSTIVAKKKSNFVFNQYLYFIARDLINLFGFFFFFPKEIKKLNIISFYSKANFNIKMKILFITHHWENNSHHSNYSGYQRLVYFISSEHKVTVLTWGKRDYEYFIKDIRVLVKKTPKRDHLYQRRILLSWYAHRIRDT